jgi:hypothetical protein
LVPKKIDDSKYFGEQEDLEHLEKPQDSKNVEVWEFLLDQIGIGE